MVHGTRHLFLVSNEHLIKIVKAVLWKISSQPSSVSLPPSAKISSCTLPPFRLGPPSAIGVKLASRTIFNSIPRRIGSAMPYARRSDSIFMASWVSRQASRRASRGWADDGMLEAFSEGVPCGACSVMLLRRVSGRPGAEGAPLLG